MKIVAVIPAHLASVRFPRKILFDFHGLPMIEHVRRRALLSKSISDVYVATCDNEIADVIKSFGGKVIMTSNSHTNGTSRVAEAIADIECSHVMLLQGDEPLLLPRHLDEFAKTIGVLRGPLYFLKSPVSLSRCSRSSSMSSSMAARPDSSRVFRSSWL